ncbi:hypothetical protein HELRODRAFT_183552 [Helobdella robusta]|uniref:Uncharacterized protein n=1 Tax=Helobdella robusta TaxID=6412 RepID=T1FJU0_HELRO|nr:hypothetical protein HELRODRAFT_183552 [Helobdella robusta]ESO10520.1 hypothetical protein HELRODRAFT_183552 [Helobdella robusta]
MYNNFGDSRPVNLPGHVTEVFFVYDYVHVQKNVRNNTEPKQDLHFTEDGQSLVVQWRDMKALTPWQLQSDSFQKLFGMCDFTAGLAVPRCFFLTISSSMCCLQHLVRILWKSFLVTPGHSTGEISTSLSDVLAADKVQRLQQLTKFEVVSGGHERTFSFTQCALCNHTLEDADVECVAAKVIFIAGYLSRKIPFVVHDTEDETSDAALSSALVMEIDRGGPTQPTMSTALFVHSAVRLSEPKFRDEPNFERPSMSAVSPSFEVSKLRSWYAEFDVKQFEGIFDAIIPAGLQWNHIINNNINNNNIINNLKSNNNIINNIKSSNNINSNNNNIINNSNNNNSNNINNSSSNKNNSNNNDDNNVSASYSVMTSILYFKQKLFTSAANEIIIFNVNIIIFVLALLTYDAPYLTG